MILRQPIGGRGRVAAAAVAVLSAYCAYVGDSLTAPSYELVTGTWAGGLNGGVLRPVANIGVAGETVSQVLARIDNLYTDPNPGLAGVAAAASVAKLGFIYLLLGTNNARALQGWTDIASAFTALIAKLLTYADRVFICAVPPMTAPESNPSGKNACTIDINAGYAAFAASNPATCAFIDGAKALRVGGSPSGAGISSYFSDGVHMNQAGVRAMGVEAGAAMAAALTAWSVTYTAPLVKANSDSYNANPAIPQWADNPAMLGSGANSNGNFTGNVVTGVTVAPSGTGAGTVSVVAADGGDPNQTPWQRVAPTAGQGSAWTQVSIANHGRTILSGDPSRPEALVEVRFNALDLTNVKRLTFSARGNTTNNRYILPEFWLGLGPEATTFSRTVVMRSNLPRVNGTNESGITLMLNLEYQNSFSGASMGSFDFRCLSLRG